MVDILPKIDDPSPILTLFGTLSILCNRIKFKNELFLMDKDGNLKIKMEDKYFNKWALEQFLNVLNLPSEFVTVESVDDRSIILIERSFNLLMNIYLEYQKYPVSTINITME
jgi:hypothetical protein